jgi:hypothetical protein
VSFASDNKSKIIQRPLEMLLFSTCRFAEHNMNTGFPHEATLLETANHPNISRWNDFPNTSHNPDVRHASQAQNQPSIQVLA